MINTVVCVLANLFRIYVVLRYVKTFFDDTEVDRKKILVVCSLYLLGNTGLYLLWHHPLINILTNLVGIAFLVLLYTSSVKKVLFVTTTIYVIAMVCDTIVVWTLFDYQIGQELNEFYSVIMIFLFLCCQLILERILSFGRKNVVVQSLSLLLVPLSSILLLVFVGLADVQKEGMLVGISIGLLIITFLVLYLYNMLLRAFAGKYEKEVLEQRMREYQNQMNLITESEAQMASIRHDLKHHLYELKLMAERQDTSELKKYIGNIEEFWLNSGERLYSGQQEVDCLLNYWISRAKQSLQNVNVKVSLPDELRDTFDICTILGNLLENAIEAAVQTKEQRLDVQISYDKGILRINVENSYQGKLRQSNGHFLTTKSDSVKHGIGLHNVQQIVNKYNGVMNVLPQEKDFVINIVLYV